MCLACEKLSLCGVYKTLSYNTVTLYNFILCAALAKTYQCGEFLALWLGMEVSICMISRLTRSSFFVWKLLMYMTFRNLCYPLD